MRIVGIVFATVVSCLFVHGKELGVVDFRFDTSKCVLRGKSALLVMCYRGSPGASNVVPQAIVRDLAVEGGAILGLDASSRMRMANGIEGGVEFRRDLGLDFVILKLQVGTSIRGQIWCRALRSGGQGEMRISDGLQIGILNEDGLAFDTTGLDGSLLCVDIGAAVHVRAYESMSGARPLGIPEPLVGQKWAYSASSLEILNLPDGSTAIRWMPTERAIVLEYSNDLSSEWRAVEGARLDDGEYRVMPSNAPGFFRLRHP